MRLKLDENLGNRGAELFESAGHEVSTVATQGLCSATDRVVLAACQKDSRCLVTLDLVFGNPLVFPPHEHAGRIVIRLSPRPGPSELYDAIRTAVRGLEINAVEGKLWLVQKDRIRESGSE